MRRVTKENLIAQIDRLRKIKDEQGQLSMSGEYTLQAYEMLLATMDSEPVVPDEYVAIVPTPTNLGYEAGWNACRSAILNRKR